MFPRVLFAAFALSAFACLGYDIHERVLLARVDHQLALRRLESTHRNAQRLQQQVELINQVKDLQHTTDDAVQMLQTLESEANTVETVSIVNAKKVVVRGRAESARLVNDAAKRLGLNVQFDEVKKK